MGNNGVARVGMMLGATVIVLLIPLPRAGWSVAAGMGTALVASLVLAAALSAAVRTTPTRLAVGVGVVVAIACAAPALTLVVRDPAVGVLGVVVIALGAVVHRVVVMITERTLGTGTLPAVAGALGAVAYGLTVALAVVGHSTTSTAVAIGLGTVAGLGEGVLAGRLLRRELTPT